MMIIDVRKLNAQKKYSGTLEFEYEAPENLIDIPFVKFSSPVKVEAEYELFEDDSLELRGKILYTLGGQCSRCLKETSERVEGELDAYFQPLRAGKIMPIRAASSILRMRSTTRLCRVCRVRSPAAKIVRTFGTQIKRRKNQRILNKRCKYGSTQA